MAGKDAENREEVSPRGRGQVVADGGWESVGCTQH